MRVIVQAVYQWEDILILHEDQTPLLSIYDTEKKEKKNDTDTLFEVCPKTVYRFHLQGAGHIVIVS